MAIAKQLKKARLPASLPRHLIKRNSSLLDVRVRSYSLHYYILLYIQYSTVSTVALSVAMHSIMVIKQQTIIGELIIYDIKNIYKLSERIFSNGNAVLKNDKLLE